MLGLLFIRGEMKKKSHANAADKTGFSVVLPTVLADALREMANEQSRNRNAQINFILKAEIARWKAANVPKTDSKPPIRLKVSPDAQKPRKNDSGQACA